MRSSKKVEMFLVEQSGCFSRSGKGSLSVLRRGAAAVEFALVAPFLITIAMGTLEFGQTMRVCQVMSQAVREGARHASQDGSTNSSVGTIVKNIIGSGTLVLQENITVTVTVMDLEGNPVTGGGQAGTDVSNANNFNLVSVHVSIPVEATRITPTNFIGGGDVVSYCAMRHH